MNVISTDNHNNIEMYLVSGFLGSGKTSFLQNMLTHLPNSRVGVIVNEFGSIGIDGTVIQKGELTIQEINNGSIFCACLKGGFTRTLAAFLSQPVDYLFVEASGLADPDNMETYFLQVEKMMLKKPEVTRRYNYRGGICVADAVNFEDYLDIFPVVESQIQKSRFILLNKCDQVSEEEQKALTDMILEINPEACVYPTSYGKVTLDVLEEKLLKEDPHAESLNTPWNRPVTYIVDMPVRDTAVPVHKFCRKIAPLTIRMKGFAPVGDGLCHVEAVSTEIVFEDMAKDEAPHAKLKLVLIGREDRLTQEAIEEAWRTFFDSEIVMVKDW
ncbi:MAG: GTP-binding protein [Lachnospiraceae bacterium]|nr:GTP-binding protein [Lachnospiraceae bacterium]